MGSGRLPSKNERSPGSTEVPNESPLASSSADPEWWPILRLWLTRRSALERICLHWTRGCRADAEDLLSDAVARALEVQLPPEAISSQTAWLTAIIANLGRDRWRRGRHEVRLDLRQCRPDELMGEQALCDDALHTRRELARFLGRESGLSSAQRHALLSRCVGESYRDVARSLNMSESRARKLVQEARQLVRANSAGVPEP
jgi:DNA-directed RNA polymerase specialized sigma24 family protein